jgi:hypothetical protein
VLLLLKPEQQIPNILRGATDEYVDQDVLMPSIQMLKEPRIVEGGPQDESHESILNTRSFIGGVEKMLEYDAEIGAAIHGAKVLSYSFDLSGSPLDEDVDKWHNPFGGSHVEDRAEDLQVSVDCGIHARPWGLTGRVRIRADTCNHF